MVKKFSKMDYEEYITSLRTLLAIDDSPVVNVGKIWTLKAPMDAWFILAEYINNEHLKIFRDIIIPILTQTHPKYELEEEKRWLASIYNKDSLYSE